MPYIHLIPIPVKHLLNLRLQTPFLRFRYAKVVYGQFAEGKRKALLFATSISQCLTWSWYQAFFIHSHEENAYSLHR